MVAVSTENDRRLVFLVAFAATIAKEVDPLDARDGVEKSLLHQRQRAAAAGVRAVEQFRRWSVGDMAPQK
jgi:hypothetical protein